MHEIHPAAHTPHSWRDFFIHIATIVIGLLIAVGLEQTVEIIHHHKQRAELRASLSPEIDEILKNAADTEDRKLWHIGWLDRRIAQVKYSLAHNTPLPPPEIFHYPNGTYVFASDPIWLAAKVNDRVALLSDDEITAYSGIEFATREVATAHANEELARGKMNSFAGELPVGADGQADWSQLTPADLREYLHLLNDDRETVQAFRIWSIRDMGAAECVRRGDLSLADIYSNQQKLLAEEHL